MNRKKYLNYGIFLAIVAAVVGLAVRHSRHMAYLVDSMAGPDRERRIAGAKELVKAEQFMDAITGETTAKRVRIAQSLEDWGTKEAAKQAVAFLKDPDRPVRDRLTVALLAIGTRDADTLAEVVAGIKDGDGNVRKACIAVLQTVAQTDPADARRIMVRALPDTSPSVLEAAYAKRSATVAGQTITKVVALMKADPAARGTGGDVLAALVGQDETCVAALLPQLEEADDGVCSGAASALGKIGSKTAVPALIDKMKKRSAQVRRGAIGALALIADRSCEAALTEALENPDDDNEARAQAAVGLGRVASPTAVATLIRALEDTDLKVQVASVGALARAETVSLAPLLGAVRSPNAHVRFRASQALGGIAAPAVNGGLVAGLSDSDRAVRLEAAKALGFAGNSGAVGPLVALLANRDGTLAAAAADSLSRIGAPAQSALGTALGGPDTGAFFAARALSGQGQSAVEAAVAASGRSAKAAKWAGVALAAIGGPKASEALRRLAENPDADARATAQMALRRLSMQ